MPEQQQDLQDELHDTREVLDLAQAIFELCQNASDRPRVGVAALLIALGDVCGSSSRSTTARNDWDTIVTDEHGFALFDHGWQETREACDSLEARKRGHDT